MDREYVYRQYEYAIELNNLEAVERLIEENPTFLREHGYNVLCKAIQVQRWEISNVLLANKCRVNRETPSTPLHLAVDRSVNNIVESLLKNGANVNDVNKSGQTPLHNASKTGNVEIMTTLFNFGANVYLRDSDGKYPLHHACEARYNEEEAVQSVEFLLNRGADVDACTRDNKTPLYLATEKGHSKVVELLLQHKPKIDIECNQRCVYVAVNTDEENSKKIFDALLEYGFSFDAQKAMTYPKFFENAVRGSHYKIVEELLKHGVDVNIADPVNRRTPLHFAAQYAEDLDICKLLLTYGAQVNSECSQKETPFFVAVTSNKLDLVKLFLNNGVNFKNYFAIFHYKVDEEVFLGTVDAILEQDKSFINLCNERGKSLLHYSLFNCNDKMFFYFMSKGADVNASTVNGLNCLHLASLGRLTNSEVFNTLLAKGVSVHSKTVDGTTPLHVAVATATPPIIEILLQHGADVNAADNEGKTALHIAAKCRSKNVVTLLLDYGSDINMTMMKENQTPLDHALSRGDSMNWDDDFDSDPADEPWSTKTGEVLMENIIKLRSAGLYVSDRNQNLLEEAYQLRDYIDEYEDRPRFNKGNWERFQKYCEEEIALMKCHMVGNTAISFYDVLRLKTSPLARVMMNDDIIHVLKTVDYETLFPIYASMIKLLVYKTITRRELLDKGNAIFHVVYSGLPKLNAYCADELFSYFNNMDIKNLIDAGKLAGFNRI